MLGMLFQRQRHSFNSNLVRLKARLESFVESVVNGFNSNLVRLKVVSSYSFPVVVNPFQFQSGAIKSSLAASFATFFQSFNSNLVRLKAQTVMITVNFTLVSIPIWCD